MKNSKDELSAVKWILDNVDMKTSSKIHIMSHFKIESPKKKYDIIFKTKSNTKEREVEARAMISGWDEEAIALIFNNVKQKGGYQGLDGNCENGIYEFEDCDSYYEEEVFTFLKEAKSNLWYEKEEHNQGRGECSKYEHTLWGDDNEIISFWSQNT